MTPVTDHAVLRWLERVRLVDFSHCPGGWPEFDRATWGCRQIGMSLDDARDEILPPRLQRYLALDPLSVRAHDRVLVVLDRTVVTCLEAGARTTSTPERYGHFADCP